MFCRESYQKGYDAAYGELYRSSGDGCSHEGSDSCRACGVVAEITENLVQQLAAWMTNAEIDAFTDMVVRVGERRRSVMKGPGSGGWEFLW